jgi:ribosomal-protein-alanine N-acetyltransferase
MCPPNSEKLEIRRMIPEDLDAVEQIQAASLPNSAAGWAARDFLNLEAFVAIREAGTVEGFLVCRRTAEDECELLNMAVAPERRRRGCGKALLEHVLECQPGIWFLEVRASNVSAQALYSSLGFHRSGLRRDYYRSPAEDAIEMSKHS